jgi:hypothetical protein
MVMTDTLGPDCHMPLPGCPGFSVRISESIRKAVVFFGYPDGRGGITCIGTGFLVGYDQTGYLVTAKHLCHQLGTDPFIIRINKRDGTSENIFGDGIKWVDHPDPTVDVSVIPFGVAAFEQFDVKFINLDASDVKNPNAPPGYRIVPSDNVGIGALTYTVGLFRLLSGKQRNLPIVHSGSVAMLPSDELIPLKDWTDPEGKRTIFVDGYLVGSHGLSGLSGSPVFVRPEYDVDLNGLFPRPAEISEREFKFVAPRSSLRLLGLWQGSWDAPPDEVMTTQTGRGVTVSVGVGIVVPSERIVEVLDMPELKGPRDEYLASVAANPQSAAVSPAAASAPPASDANPTHREDFMRLVGAAARKPPQAD